MSENFEGADLSAIESIQNAQNERFVSGGMAMFNEDVENANKFDDSDNLRLLSMDLVRLEAAAEKVKGVLGKYEKATKHYTAATDAIKALREYIQAKRPKEALEKKKLADREIKEASIFQSAHPKPSEAIED